MKRFPLILCVLVVLSATGVAAAGPRVDVVVGSDAPRLERFAASELAGQLKALFAADAHIAEKVPDRAEHLVLVGSPQTNPAVKALAGDRWPKLTDQGHVLRSVE